MPDQPLTDLSAAGWIAPRLGRWWTVAGLVPRGFAAHARVLHPAPTEPPTRWAQVCAGTGVAPHALMRWSEITRGDEERWGWEAGDAPWADLRSVLEAHSDGRAWFGAVWAGWGWLTRCTSAGRPTSSPRCWPNPAWRPGRPTRTTPSAERLGHDGRVALPLDPRPARPRGRRRAGEETRGALVAAARAAFAELGYDGATVRGIAARAGVDAAMVNHWFGGKEGLFAAAVEVPIDPVALVQEITEGDSADVGARLVRRFLTIWDATGGAPLATLIRSVAAHETAARMLREFVTRVVVARIAAAVAPDRPDLRATLAGSQMIGLGMARYVVRLEPIASADREELVAAVGPTIQRYLTEPL